VDHDGAAADGGRGLGVVVSIHLVVVDDKAIIVPVPDPDADLTPVLGVRSASMALIRNP
jgi:hypothetical protein